MIDGVTLISNNDYKELILKEKELEDVFEDCKNEIFKLKNRYETMEKYLLNWLYDENKYDIRNLTYDGNNFNEDYHYKELFNKFVQIGIKDTSYIKGKIFEFYKKYLEENKEQKNNE